MTDSHTPQGTDAAATTGGGPAASTAAPHPVTPSSPGTPARRTVAVVLAAGLGTRMKSATPKVLHRICGRPMIDYVLDAAVAATGTRPLVVYSPATEAVRDAVAGRADGALQDVPRGTGDALRAALEALDPGRRGDPRAVRRRAPRPRRPARCAARGTRHGPRGDRARVRGRDRPHRPRAGRAQRRRDRRADRRGQGRNRGGARDQRDQRGPVRDRGGLAPAPDRRPAPLAGDRRAVPHGPRSASPARTGGSLVRSTWTTTGA